MESGGLLLCLRSSTTLFDARLRRRAEERVVLEEVAVELLQDLPQRLVHVPHVRLGRHDQRPAGGAELELETVMGAAAARAPLNQICSLLRLGKDLGLVVQEHDLLRTEGQQASGLFLGLPSAEQLFDGVDLAAVGG